ncbi:phage tail assembly chaperone [Ahrensia sp. R2A130]|uniref:phage tail assembly chaperone n=1 Tax=Ahrensia sp. R2A130 TaxID=744979 RepID=UPI0001E0E8C4|nr:phage tail assembly chaperone [Ahrensia sp. R2A130]EFL88962.1 hypothetical protein R2A130_1448 [Ahrensia sp. R2A130]
MAEPQPFPWAEAMAFGFGRLKLSSAEFWALTLPELAAAMRAYGLGEPNTVDRDWLNGALKDHPDPQPNITMGDEYDR